MPGLPIRFNSEKDGQKSPSWFRQGDPYNVTEVDYNFEDEGLREVVIADTANSLIRPGIIFDVDVLQNERIRLETYLKTKGYFYFSREHVYFDADTTSGNKSVELTLGISLYRSRDESGQFTETKHQRYRIGNVFIFPSHNPREAIDMQDEYYENFDTINFRNMQFFYKDRIPVNPRVIAQSILFFPMNSTTLTM
jgi:hypothetical protein